MQDWQYERTMVMVCTGMVVIRDDDVHGGCGVAALCCPTFASLLFRADRLESLLYVIETGWGGDGRRDGRRDKTR